MTSDDLGLRGQIWITAGRRSLGGHGRIGLLELIDAHGSISQAAKLMKMSYKAAWDAVDQMNNLAGEALVMRHAGGKGGGSTRLTERGRQFVKHFRLLELEHRRFVERLGALGSGLDSDLALLRRLTLKTSARNQLSGIVGAIKSGTIHDEIEIILSGGWTMVSVITRLSAEDLKLRTGDEVFALIKASDVMLMAPDRSVRLSTRNRIDGCIERLQKGGVNYEVSVTIAGGHSLTAVVTAASIERLSLMIDQPVTAFFNASDVIIGVPI